LIFRKIAKKILLKYPPAYTAAHSLNFELKHRQNFSKFEDKEKEILLKIQRDSFAVIPDFFDKDLCQACINDIEWMLKNKKEFVHKAEDLRIFGAELLSKNIRKFANHELFTKLANAYNAVPTCLGFTLANKIEALGQEYGSGGSWHRDSYFRQFKTFIYLTDVDESNGPFQLVLNSNNSKQIKEDAKTGNLEQMQSRFEVNEVERIVKDDPKRLHTLTAKAGTVVLLDTSVIHRGLPMRKGVRYALTNYFFEKTQMNSHLVEHFSPIVSPEKVLKMGQK